MSGDYKEGWELLKEAAMAVTHMKERIWQGYRRGQVISDLWQQVRARLKEKMPEHRMLDVMGALLLAELRIWEDECSISSWSNQMLVERLGEQRLRMLLEEETAAKWRLVGIAPNLRILSGELADLYEQAAELYREKGENDPEYHAKLQEVKSWMTLYALKKAKERMPKNIADALQPFAGVADPSFPSGSVALDLANGRVAPEWFDGGPLMIGEAFPPLGEIEVRLAQMRQSPEEEGESDQGQGTGDSAVTNPYSP